MSFDVLQDKIRAMKNPTVAGLDARIDYVPEHIRQAAVRIYDIEGCIRHARCRQVLRESLLESKISAPSMPASVVELQLWGAVHNW